MIMSWITLKNKGNALIFLAYLNHDNPLFVE